MRSSLSLPSPARTPKAQPEPEIEYDPIQWMQENFVVYDTGELLELYECQIRPLREALRKDEKGNFVYNTVVWSWPKKSAKSTCVAAVVDFKCATRKRTSAKLIANDLKQADSRVGAYIRENLRQNEARLPTVRIKPSGYAIDYLNRSRIEMIPIDPTGEAGGNDDVIVYSELWGWKSKAQIQMWEEMTLSPNKFRRSQRWIDTYAGMYGESPILENLYDLGVNKGRRLWPDHEVYVNDAARLLCVWVTKPMLPWQLDEDGQAYYVEQAHSLSPEAFNRMHRNQWVSSSSAFVPEPWWLGCKGVLPQLRVRQPLVLAVDAGVTSDCFAIVGVTREARKIEAEKHEFTQVRYAQTWKAGPNGKIDFADPEAELIRLCKTYNVSMVMYDPYQLHELMTRFRRRLIAPAHEFDQGQRRSEADKHLYDLIRDQHLEWDERVPNMDDLRSHVMNANRKDDNEKLRLIKRTDDGKIDLVVALSMAAHEAKRLNIV